MHMKNPSVYDDAYLYEPEEIDEYWIAGPVDLSSVEIVKGINENFADGKKPGRKGLSKRVGIPKNATIAQLEKIAKNSTGERRRMAQWQLNMRRGKNKSK